MQPPRSPFVFFSSVSLLIWVPFLRPDLQPAWDDARRRRQGWASPTAKRVSPGIKLSRKRDKSQESVRCQNRNFPEWIKNQQILIACHNTIRSSDNSGFQQLVVVGITADPYHAG